jgi:hypothetical protein
MDLLDEYTELVNTLDSEGIEYATCGGLALAVHGLVRATKDIDLLIRPEDLDAAFSIAKRRGFDIEGLPLNFDDGAMQLRRLSKIDPDTKLLVTVDFLLVTDRSKHVWEGRERVEWGSGSAWVVSKQGLIDMKKHAGRDQDIVDIKRLLEEEDDDES